jgi:HrpA-like RNA helicase
VGILESAKVTIKGKGGKKYNTYAEWDEEYASNTESEDDEDNKDKDTPTKSYSQRTLSTVKSLHETKINYELMVHLVETFCTDESRHKGQAGGILIFMPGYMEIRRLYDDLMGSDFISKKRNRFQVYPLHSVLTGEEQQQVFVKPPEGVWKIVIVSLVSLSFFQHA